MTGEGVVFGLLWAAVGVVLAIRWRAERARWQATGPTTLVTAGRVRFGTDVEDGSGRRQAAMLLSYAAGSLVVAVGIVTRTEGLLGIGAVLVNAGTVLRFLVVALDRSHLESPVVVTRKPARHLGQPGRAILDLAN